MKDLAACTSSTARARARNVTTLEAAHRGNGAPRFCESHPPPRDGRPSPRSPPCTQMDLLRSAKVTGRQAIQAWAQRCNSMAASCPTVFAPPADRKSFEAFCL